MEDFQVCEDGYLPTLEANIREAIRVYLGDAEPHEPLSDFVGTWRVEVAA